MRSVHVLAAIAQQDDELRRLKALIWADRYEEKWRDYYPHQVSTLGTRSPRPEIVEQRLGVQLLRIPIAPLGFTLWGFRTAADLRAFLSSLPSLA